jgi:hypothetical protein
MIFEQEELDWEAYRLYGLLSTDMTYAGSLETLSLGERAFEIALARKIDAGEEESAWFERHGSTPITDLPAAWPAAYLDLVQRRLEVIEAEPFINLLERPENKRRWATVPWDVQQGEALRSAILDRLEDPALWHDARGAVTRSVAQLSDLLRDDRTLRTLLELLQGSSEVDVVPVLTSLVADESVPYLAACRYKALGLVKFREWQHVWDLQRGWRATGDWGEPAPRRRLRSRGAGGDLPVSAVGRSLLAVPGTVGPCGHGSGPETTCRRWTLSETRTQS